MKIAYSASVTDALETAPASVQKAFFKQIRLLEENLRHPSLRAKKYDEANDRWQARVNKSWRFYFKIIDETSFITELMPHPK
jgi:mRNA-degrading endonuclease RelE of RelBE toxin-antitoxin system